MCEVEKMSMPGRVALIAMLSSVPAGAAFAQATATINGRVVDQASAVLPGVTMTVTETTTGVARETVSNGEGLYSLPALNPGTYSVNAALAGFSPQRRNDVILLTGATLTVDFQLGLAGIAESVTVSGALPLIEVTQSVVSSNLRTDELHELPMINRNFISVLTVLPGVRDLPNTSGLKGVQGGAISVGGSAGSNVIMLVDGVDNHDDNNGGTLMRYSMEGVEEFNLLLHNFSAEYGKTSGAAIVMATRSGTNEVHGSAFGFGRSDALTKIDYLSDPAHGGAGKASYHRENYGGSVGGPIVRNRAFFAASMEGINQLYNLPVPANITAEEQYLAPFGAVPATQIPQPLRTFLVTAKTNVQFSKGETGFLRYSIEDDRLQNDGLGANHSLLACCSTADVNSNRTWNVSLGLTSVLSPAAVNQFTWQYLHYFNSETFPDCPMPQCLLQKLSFPSVAAGAIGNVNPWTNTIDKLQFKDDFSRQIGRHALKVGADLGLFPNWGALFTVGTPGTITFFDDPSVIANNTNGRYPLGFQTPGIVRQITQISPLDPDVGLQVFNADTQGARDLGFYVQDDFKVHPRLTLNLGLRWDGTYNFLNQTELSNNRTYLTLRAIGSPYGVIPTIHHDDYAPRVGFAWDTRGDGKRVVRGGFGIFYERPLINSTYLRNMQEHTYLYASATQTNSAIGVGTLRNFVFMGPNASPVPSLLGTLTDLPPGAGVTGNWYAPDLPDGREQTTHLGYSQLISGGTVLAVDYTHTTGVNEWRNLNINPFCTATFQGPCGISGYAGAGIGQRILAPAFQAVYGDPNLLGAVNIVAPASQSRYDEVAVHFEHRLPRLVFQANYTLAWAYAYGGFVNGTTTAGYYPVEIPSATGGCVTCPGEWGPGAQDERHRLSLAGTFTLPFGLSISPTFTAATARPYQQYRAPNPSGDGSLRCYVGSCLTPGPDGSEVSVNAARGIPLVNLSARVTKRVQLGASTLDAFVELYDITDRANFGNNYAPNAFSPSTFNKPTGYLGGSGYNLTLPNSFQAQLGARLMF
jgi:hypothetical protein